MDNIKSIIATYHICIRCVRRGLRQTQALETLHDSLPDDVLSKLVEESVCQICEGIVVNTIQILDRLVEALEKYQFNTFLVGCRLNNKCKDAEKKLLDVIPNAFTLKMEITRILVEELINKFKVKLNPELPDIAILIQVKDRPRFKLDVRSIYILGRYQKLTRGIPQTKWPCTHCKGRKCEKCNFTGQQYPQSVEKIVAEPFFTFADARKSSFHGAGREDIDALMLGDGRPFVLEIKQPRKRDFVLKDVMAIINQSPDVQVNSLKFCPKRIIKKIKEESSLARKRYRAKVQLDPSPSPTQLDGIEQQVKSLLIQQRTPVRVSHRRADKIRKKTVFSVKIISQQEDVVIIDIEAQGGTYIKEFISGDGNRTQPSISSLLNASATCIELDVLMVDDKGLFPSTI